MTLYNACAGRRSVAGSAVLAAFLAASACVPGDDVPPLMADAVASPAAAGSGEPNLGVSPRGVVYLSWLEPSATGHTLMLAHLQDREWSEPRIIIDRADLFVNWADFPSLAFFHDSVMGVHWLEKSGPGIYDYDVRVALSHDDGVTWTNEMVLHRDGVKAEHGFVSLVPWGDDLAALWLDGRATVHGDPMTLRFTTVGADGGLGQEIRVDASVCDCCQTALATTATGLVAAYRDRTADEVRDIYVARYVDGEWTEGHAVHEDGWVIPGCPVNGPALATRGDTVVVAWFTAAETTTDTARTPAEIRAAGERGRVLTAFSVDGGATFGDPVRVDDGQAMGRVDAVLLDGTAAAVSWLERADDGAEVRVRRVDRAGPGPASTIAGAQADQATGFPRMTRSGHRLVFAWTQPGADGGVRTAVATLPEDWARAKGEDG